MKSVLVVGASGATGRLLVKELLQKNIEVAVIVRSTNTLTQYIGAHPNLREIKANIDDLSENDLVDYLIDCDAVVSCLGHNLTFKGMFGNPRRLVTDTVAKFCRAIEATKPSKKIKFILMNTTGNSNRDIPEKPSFSQRCVIAILRLLLPPHVDNEKAADFLRVRVGQNHKFIEWSAVRPDSLTNEKTVTKYDVHGSPTRNAIFDAGSASRINVGNFMSNLVAEEALWNIWKGKMPVIYNQS